MDMIPVLLKEMDREIVITRKMLARIPDDKYDWKAHEKSMTIQRLSVHIAELPTWVTMALTTSELDFATTPYAPKDIKTTAELLAYAEECFAQGRDTLSKASESDLLKPWSLRNGEIIYFTDPVLDVIRLTFNQITHHRAQLGVNLRLLNIPIPGSYGPSADDASM